MNNNWPLNR